MGSDQVSETELKPRVFISYSRIDKIFVEWLVARLEAEQRFEVFLDKDERRDTAEQIAKGIAPGEPWWERLQVMIRRVDIVAFVISPDSVASKVANREVDYAASLNKRLVPILHKAPGTPVPAQLARIDYFFFDRPERLDDSFDKLCFALKNDIASIREHARLIEAAERWRELNSDFSHLLRGDALSAAEYWVRNRRLSDPAPTLLLTQFLEESRTQEDIDRRERLAQIDRALTNESRYLAGLAQRAMARGDYAEALNVALEALPDTMIGRARPHVAEAERALHQAVRLCRERLVMLGRDRPEDSLTFKLEPWVPIRAAGMSADGMELFVAVAKSLRVFSVADGSLLNEIDCDEGILTARILPGQSRIAAITRSSLLCWDYSNAGQLLRTPLKTNYMETHAFNATASHCAIWMGGQTVSIFETATGIKKSETTFNTDYIKSVSLDSAAETLCVTATRACFVRKAGAKSNLWEFDQLYDSGFPPVFSASGKLLMTENGNEVQIRSAIPAKKSGWSRTSTKPVRLVGHDARICGGAFSHDETRVATASEDGRAVIWDVNDGHIISEFRGHGGQVRDIVFCGDTGLVASSGQDGATRVWRADDGHEEYVLGGHHGREIRAAYSSASAILSSWSSDGTSRIWDANVDNGRRLIARLEASIWSVTFDRTGERVAAASQDGTVRVWGVEDGVEQICLHASDQAVYDTSFSPDGRHLVTASLDATARVWDLTSAGVNCIGTLQHRSKVNAVSHSQRGDLILTACTDGSAQIWTAKDFHLLRSLDKHPGGVEQAMFSPDERYVLTIASGGAAYLWDLGSGLKRDLFDMGSLVTAATFAPEGNRICLATFDRRFRIYDIAHASFDEFPSTDEESEAVAERLYCSRDGARLLSIDSDGKARIRSASTGIAVAILPAETRDLSCARFLPNEEGVAGVLDRTSLYVWPNYKDTQTLVDKAKRFAPRGLSREERHRLHLNPDQPEWYSAFGKLVIEPALRR